MCKKHHQRTLAGFDDLDPPKSTTAETGESDSAVVDRTAEPSADSASDAMLSAVKTMASKRAKPESAAKRTDFPTVFVIDAHALLYQVFHALPEMTSPSGQPVGAIHGFIRDMVDLLENQRPDYLFCAFDAPGDTFRHRLYDQYKAQREEMPADLQPQIAGTRRMLEAMGIPVLVAPGYEADDLLATLARQAEDRGLICYLVTSDKDCRQLIRDRVVMFNIRKNEVLDAAALMDDWGVRPDQVVDFQALVGDKVDNVPGVPLIGPKNARELLEKYQTLDGVLDHASEVSGTKRRENLLRGRELALLSRQLVKLNDAVPIDIDWQAGRVVSLDFRRVQPLCQEFGFRKLAERLEALSETVAATTTANAATWQADYRTVATVDQLYELVAQLQQQSRIAIDTETTSTSPRWAELVGCSLAWQPGLAFYIPVRAPVGEPQLAEHVVLAALRPILENPDIEKVGQNLKYDTVVLRSAGVELRGLAFDTMVADYLVDPGERSHGMDDLAYRLLDHETIKITELIGSGKKQKRMDEVPVAQITQYAAEDADVPLRLSVLLARRLVDEGLESLFHDLEMPLIEVLAEMEFNGIRVDLDRLRELGQRFAQRMEQLQAEIYALAGGEFNIDSRTQLSKILFEDLKLPVSKKTKTGPSTDVEVLTELARLHELPAKIVAYRQASKLKSTYVDALIELVHPRTGRVHTSFKQDVAATGRLSSKDPNLQNIPVRTEEGREIRSAFLPGDADWRLLTADYSQIELRVLAHFSGDPTLCQAFAEDQDIHARVAAEVNGVPLAQVTREMRSRAKAVNFGVIYGQSAFGLAKALGIEQEDAAAFIAAYFARYPGVDKFIHNTLAECRATSYVKTILGRRRTIHGVRDPSTLGDSHQRILPERIAINTVIQGSAADLIKQAMIQVHRRMRHESLRSRMLLQIHDELVFEVPADEIDGLSVLVREEMTSVQSLAVPLKIDVKVGKNWAECEPLD